MAELIDTPLSQAFRDGAAAERRDLGTAPDRFWVVTRAEMHARNADHFTHLAEMARGRLRADNEWLTADLRRRVIEAGGQP